MAQAWHNRIQTGKAKSRADLARQLGVSRAYVTQVLRLLCLAPKVREAVLALGDPMEGRIVAAHSLRYLAKLSAEGQQREIARLLGTNGHDP